MIMKKFQILLMMLAAMFFTAANVSAQEYQQDDLLGIWLNEDEDAHIEIYKEGNTYAGKIIWLEEPVYPADDDGGMAGKEKVDRENPDEGLRDRPIQGLELMSGFVSSGGGKWKKGTIYAPDEGKTYKCKLSLNDDGTLKVRGYIGISLLGRNELWTPVPAKD